MGGLQTDARQQGCRRAVMCAQSSGPGGRGLLVAITSRFQARQASNQLLNRACRSSSCLCA